MEPQRNGSSKGQIVWLIEDVDCSDDLAAVMWQSDHMLSDVMM